MNVDPAQVKALRGFNRFYTQRIGMLARYLDSEFSLTQVRVLYELAHRDRATASELRRDLGLDAGYLSRLLRDFEAKGWLSRSASPDDARQSLLRLTEAGYAAFAPLQQKSRDEAAALLAPLPPAARTRVIAALSDAHRLLEGEARPGAASAAAPADARADVVLRDPQPGDMGWVVQQHGEIYWREYGWDQRFEALVASIVARMIERFDPAWEKGWIAERGGQRLGSAFVVRKSARVAQLRLLILAPAARGHGLGGRLTDECITFARARGYRKMVLWTNSCLEAARAIYTARGFRLVASKAYQGWGRELVGETWELVL